MQPAKSTTSVTSWASEWDFWTWCGCSKAPLVNKQQRLSVFPSSKAYLPRKKSVMKTVILTGQQRLIVMRTWHKLSVDISTLGISAMTRLMEKNVDIADLFGFRNRSSTELQSDPKFRQHAFWLIQAVSAVVENINNLDLMVSDMFVEIGQKHAAIPGFSAKFFDSLPAAWAFVWEDQLRDRFTAQTDKSWGRMFHYIVDCLIDGCSDHLVLEEIVTYSSQTTAPIATPSYYSTDGPESTSSNSYIDDDSDSDSDESSVQPRSSYARKGNLQAAVSAGKKSPELLSISKGLEDSTVESAVLSWKATPPRKSSRKGSSKQQTLSKGDKRASSSRKNSHRKNSEPTSKKQSDTNADAPASPRKVSVHSEPPPAKDGDATGGQAPPPTPSSKQLPPTEAPSARPKAEGLQPVTPQDSSSKYGTHPRPVPQGVGKVVSASSSTSSKVDGGMLKSLPKEP